MYVNLKKTTTGFVTSLLVCTAMYAAEPKNTHKGILNPPAEPYIAAGVGVFFDGELLLWKARETGLDYAVKANYNAPHKGQFVTNNSGTTKNPDFNWDFGFRFGLGWNPNKDGWDLFLDWTHLHTTASDKVNATPAVGTRIFPEFQAFAIPDKTIYYTNADSHWRLDYNTLDFEVGREYFVSRRLTLRPNIGLRAAWVHQDYDVNYLGYLTNVISLPPTPPPFSAPGRKTPVTTQMYSNIEMRNNFNGVGPRIGLDANWILGSGFSFYGDAEISLLVGQFHVKYQETSSGTQGISVVPLGMLVGAITPDILRNNQFTDVADLTESFTDTRAVTDLGLGVRWAHKFFDERYQIRLQLGWDQHLFFGQNQFITYESDAQIQRKAGPTTRNPSGAFRTTTNPTSELNARTQRRGDLSLQGFNFSVRLDF